VIRAAIAGFVTAIGSVLLLVAAYVSLLGTEALLPALQLAPVVGPVIWLSAFAVLVHQ